MTGSWSRSRASLKDLDALGEMLPRFEHAWDMSQFTFVKGTVLDEGWLKSVFSFMIVKNSVFGLAVPAGTFLDKVTAKFEAFLQDATRIAENPKEAYHPGCAAHAGCAAQLKRYAEEKELLKQPLWRMMGEIKAATWDRQPKNAQLFEELGFPVKFPH